MYDGRTSYAQAHHVLSYDLRITIYDWRTADAPAHHAYNYELRFKNYAPIAIRGEQLAQELSELNPSVASAVAVVTFV